MVENAKIEKLKCDILGDFQTLCARFFFKGSLSTTESLHHRITIVKAVKWEKREF